MTESNCHDVTSEKQPQESQGSMTRESDAQEERKELRSNSIGHGKKLYCNDLHQKNFKGHQDQKLNVQEPIRE